MHHRQGGAAEIADDGTVQAASVGVATPAAGESADQSINVADDSTVQAASIGVAAPTAGEFADQSTSVANDGTVQAESIGAAAPTAGESADQPVNIDNSDSDSDDDGVVLADLAKDPTKWPKVNAVSDFANRMDVDGDGNCGFRAIDAVLSHVGNPIFPKGRPSKPITCMRKAIHDDIDENRKECFGTGRKEDDQVEHLKIVCYHANYPHTKKKKSPFWVDYSLNKGVSGRYKGIFASKDLGPFIDNTLLGVTWQDKWDFDRRGCLSSSKVKFFMSVQKHLPAASKLYKTSIICYTDKQDELPNGATFACIYNKSSGVVTIYDIKGIRKPPPNIPCIYKCSGAHFNWLRLKY